MALTREEKEKALGSIKGFLDEAKGRARTDSEQRVAAGQKQNSVILTKTQVQSEAWDSHRVLHTTLGGINQPITTEHLKSFRQNISSVGGKLQKGITARQVINMAIPRPLANAKNESDIDRSRNEINMAVPVTARAVNKGGLVAEIRFITNAGPDSDVTRHHVLIRFNNFGKVATKLMSATKSDTSIIKKAAIEVTKDKLAYDCDCGRHRYWFRYITTIGAFNAGRDELGYPKVRNPHLVGVACKHVLRVMANLESSVPTMKFIEKFLSEVMASEENHAKIQIKQKEAKLHAKEDAPIIRSKIMEAEKKALLEAVKNVIKSKTKPAMTKMIDAAISAGAKGKDLAADILRKVLSENDAARVIDYIFGNKDK